MWEETIGVCANPGAFTVTPMRAEGLAVGSDVQVSLSVTLMPFNQLLFIPPSVGPDFKWTTSVMLKNSNPSKRRVFVLVQVFTESSHGQRTCIGAY